MRFNLKNAVIKIKDGTTPTAQEVTVKVADGEISWEESRELDVYKDRGNLDSIELKEDNPLSVNLSFAWEYFQGDSVDTPYEALKGTTDTAWVSTDSNSCTSKACDIEIVFTPGCSTEKIETITISKFHYQSINPSSGNKLIAVRGICNAIAPTFARSAQA